MHFLLRCLLALSLGALSCLAQPSGGPYGPRPQTYEIPAGAKRIFFVAPEALPDNDGLSLERPSTLEAVFPRLTTGDVVVLRGGTYRTGGLLLNQGVVLQPYKDEIPVLKGTEIAKDWVEQANGLWRCSWKKLFPKKPSDWWQRDREGRQTPFHKFNNDMVFIDGRSLRSAGWEGELDKDSFYIDYAKGEVYLAQNPVDHLVEITAHDSAILRPLTPCHGRVSDRLGYTLKGLTFTQYAYRALEIEGTEPEKLADPAGFGLDVVGTTLEDLTITHCSRVAGYFRGNKLTIRHCYVSDTSTEGIYIISSSDVLLERTVIARNNIEKITGYYPAAVKIFNQCYRAVCRDNLVIDQPDSHGIWYDVGNVDALLVNNWFENAQHGFFFEISKGAVAAGNVFVNCDHGIFVLNSRDVTVVQNTFVNCPASFFRDERSALSDHFGWHPSTGPDVHEREGHRFLNNLAYADANYHKALLRTHQAKGLRGKLKGSQLSTVEGNLYYRQAPASEDSLVDWAPAETPEATAKYSTLEAFRLAQPSFDTTASELKGSPFDPLQAALLKRFAPSRPLKKVREQLDEKTRVHLGWSPAETRSPGAYP